MANTGTYITEVHLQQYDNGKELIFELTNNGLVEAINGAIVKLKLKEVNSGHEIKRRCTITDAELAICEYIMTSEDTAIPGEYISEVEIEYANGRISSCPNPFKLIISKEVISRY